MSDLVWIECYNCLGEGVEYECNESTSNLPLQGICSTCNGERKLEVNKEFADFMGGIIDNDV